MRTTGVAAAASVVRLGIDGLAVASIAAALPTTTNSDSALVARRNIVMVSPSVQAAVLRGRQAARTPLRRLRRSPKRSYPPSRFAVCAPPHILVLPSGI